MENTEMPLTPTQRAMRAARLATDNGTSAVEAARQFAANDAEVCHARQVMATGVPELIAMMYRGELSLYMGRKIAVLPAEQQRATLERVRTEKLLDSVDRRVLAKAMDKIPMKPPAQPKTKPATPRIRNKKLAERVENCIEQMRNTVEIFGEFMDEGERNSDPELESWLDSGRKVRRTLTRILKAHKIEEEVSDGQTAEL